MKDFIPRSDAEYALWLNNFSAKLNSYSASLGLSAADITTVTNTCTQTVNLINQVEQIKKTFKTIVSQKDAARENATASLRKVASRIKTHPAFTNAIGTDLMIITPAANVQLSNMAPDLFAESFPGYVRLRFTKKGFGSVNIYSRLNGNGNWIFLARDTNSPYEDNRGLTTSGIPETREYMAIGLDGDDEAGHESNIVSVVFGG